jgi:hypothetical protein
MQKIAEDKNTMKTSESAHVAPGYCFKYVSSKVTRKYANSAAPHKWLWILTDVGLSIYPCMEQVPHLSRCADLEEPQYQARSRLDVSLQAKTETKQPFQWFCTTRYPDTIYSLSFCHSGSSIQRIVFRIGIGLSIEPVGLR